MDRAQDLAITLAALRNEWNPLLDELIIVLGPSLDDSEEVIRRSAIPCRLIPCPIRNLAVSRNQGWQAAVGKYVVFLDDDASPEPGWLNALLKPFAQDPRTGVSAGFVLDGRGAKFLNRYVVADTLGRAFWFENAAVAQMKIEEVGSHRAFLTATGCNMAFRRDVLEEIGGFDPFYQYFLEETDAVWRSYFAGYHCLVSPESRVRHRLGTNPTRARSFVLEHRTLVIRSQIHYIEKFGKSSFSRAEIGACLWEQVLRDLEKIAWNRSPRKGIEPKNSCADYQSRYLRSVTITLQGGKA